LISCFFADKAARRKKQDIFLKKLLTKCGRADIILQKIKQAEQSVLTVRRRLYGKYIYILWYSCVLRVRFAAVFCLCFKEGLTISKNDLQINEQIRDNEIRVVSADGEQLGLMSAKEAQDIAYEKGMDLVKIAPQAKPPVCKIMDYGKYKFELNKREKENRKNQKVINIKEVQLSPSIDTNDFNTKCNHAIKFLQKGDKVKVIVRFRGRELSHSQIGYTLLERFAEQAKEAGSVEKPAKLEGRNMTMFLAPLS
jgi:translation initiation factor IF-3